MARIAASAPRHNVTLVRLLWLSTFVLVLIGVAIVTRRVLILFGLVAPSPLSESAPLDDAFARYASLTMLHIVPGFVFIVLGPLQFVTTLRTRRPWVHRRIGRVVLASGLVTAVTALAITTQMAIGGATARTATTLFGVLFLRGSAGEPARDVRRRFVLSKRHSRAFRANTESFGRPRRPPRSTTIRRLRRFMTNLLLPALLPSD